MNIFGVKTNADDSFWNSTPVKFEINESTGEPSIFNEQSAMKKKYNKVGVS